MYLSPDELKKLERIAKALGYVQTRGAGAGRLGNVSALLRAVAKEQAIVRRAGEPGAEGARDGGD